MKSSPRGSFIDSIRALKEKQAALDKVHKPPGSVASEAQPDQRAIFNQVRRRAFRPMI